MVRVSANPEIAGLSPPGRRASSILDIHISQYVNCATLTESYSDNVPR